MPRPPREFRFRLPSEARGRFRTVTPERCCAALSWRIVSKRLSSSSQLSLRLKSFSQSPAKFKRIGRSRSSSGKELALRSACACTIFSGNRHRASSSAQWLKPAGLNCRVFRAITKLNPGPNPLYDCGNSRDTELFRGSKRKQNYCFISTLNQNPFNCLFGSIDKFG